MSKWSEIAQFFPKHSLYLAEDCAVKKMQSKDPSGRLIVNLLDEILNMQSWVEIEKLRSLSKKLVKTLSNDKSQFKKSVLSDFKKQKKTYESVKQEKKCSNSKNSESNQSKERKANITSFRENTKKLNLDISDSKIKKIAKYMEDVLPKKIAENVIYIKRKEAKLPCAVEYDPKTNLKFIHFKNKILGKGYTKKVTHSLIYDPQKPRECANLIIKDERLNLLNEHEFSKEIRVSQLLQKDAKHIAKTIAVTSHVKKKTGKVKETCIQEIYKNGDLSKLTSHKNPNLTNKLKIINGLLTGLHEIHSKGYLHRDIHQGNIYVNSSYAGFVGDFGFTLTVDDMKREQTMNAQMISELTAPELLVLKNIASFDEYKKGEIYSAALCIYELLYNKEFPLSDENHTLWKDFKAASSDENKELIAKQIHEKISKELILEHKELEKSIKESGENALTKLKFMTLKMLSTNPEERGDLPHWINFTKETLGSLTA